MIFLKILFKAFFNKKFRIATIEGEGFHLWGVVTEEFMDQIKPKEVKKSL